MASTEGAIPYLGNADYLDDEFAWLAIKAHRLAAEHDLREAERVPCGRGSRSGRRRRSDTTDAADEASQAAVELRTQEDELRADIDGRLEASRGAGVSLGLDQLCQLHDLSLHERLALLVATVPCLGEKLMQAVLGKLDSYIVSSPSIDMLVLLTEGNTVTDRLQIRAIFDHADVALVRNGLISLEVHGRELRPSDLPGTPFHLTDAAFRAVVGLAE